MTSYILVGKYQRFGGYFCLHLLLFNPENILVTLYKTHGGLLYCIHNFDGSDKFDSRTKKCVTFLKWELIRFFKTRT